MRLSSRKVQISLVLAFSLAMLAWAGFEIVGPIGGGVVTPVGVAQADHERCHDQPRSTSRSRTPAISWISPRYSMDRARYIRPPHSA